MRKTLFPGQASIHATFEHSALRRNMPQRNDDEGGKSTRISFSPASSVWGLIMRRRDQSHPLARDDGAVNNDGHGGLINQALRG